MTALVPSRRARLRTAGLVFATASTVLLSGCIGFTTQQATQLDTNGDVAVTLGLCQTSAFLASATTDENGCQTTEAAGAPDKLAQVILTFVVPEGVNLPSTLSVSGGEEDAEFVSTPEAIAPTVGNRTPPLGYTYAAYSSSPTTTLQPGDPTVRAGEAVANFDASGLDTDFTYGVIASWRYISLDPEDTEFAPDRAVSCGSPGGASMMGPPEALPGTACSESTLPSNLYPVGDTGRRAPVGRISDPNFTTDDGWVLNVVHTNRLNLFPSAGYPTPVTAGATAHVDFEAASTLAGEPVSVALAGSTTIPGATVSTDESLPLGGESTVTADVTVPASTPAGDYVVTLEAGAGTGLRAASTTLHVDAPATPTPTATPAPSATPAPTSTPSPTGAPASPITARASAAPAVSATPAPLTLPQAVGAAANDLTSVVQRKKKVRQLSKGAATVPVYAPGAGTVRVSILARRKVRGKLPVLAVGYGDAAEAGKVDVTIKPTEAGRAALKGGAKVKATLVLRFFGPSGTSVSAGLPITLG
jgi:hypothetical protein